MNTAETNHINLYTEPDMPAWLEAHIDPHGEPISEAGTEGLLTLVHQGTWVEKDGRHQVFAVAREGHHPVYLKGVLKDDVLHGFLYFDKPSLNRDRRVIPFTLLPPADRAVVDNNLDTLCGVLETQFERSSQGAGYPSLPKSWHHIIARYARYLEAAKHDRPVAVFHTYRPELDHGRLMSTQPMPWLIRQAFNLYVQGKLRWKKFKALWDYNFKKPEVNYV